MLAIATIAMTSCKKEEVTTDELGMATINGKVTADLDYSNDLNNGLYDQGFTKEGVEGMTVSVEVNTMYWDQTPDYSYDYEKKTYTTTTDANGNYSLEIPATDEAYTVTIKFGDVYTTRKIYTTDGSTQTEDVRVYESNRNVSIYKGASIDVEDIASVTTTNASAYEFGEMTIRGEVFADMDWTQGGNESASGSALVGKTLIFFYSYGPDYNNYGQGNEFSTTIQADGTYELTIPTSVAGGPSVNVGAKFEDLIENYIDGGGATDQAVYDYYNSYIWDGTNNFYNADIVNYDIYLNVNPL